jgi:hypothetical protein
VLCYVVLPSSGSSSPPATANSYASQPASLYLKHFKRNPIVILQMPPLPSLRDIPETHIRSKLFPRFVSEVPNPTFHSRVSSFPRAGNYPSNISRRNRKARPAPWPRLKETQAPEISSIHVERFSDSFRKTSIPDSEAFRLIKIR